MPMTETNQFLLYQKFKIKHNYIQNVISRFLSGDGLNLNVKSIKGWYPVLLNAVTILDFQLGNKKTINKCISRSLNTKI